MVVYNLTPHLVRVVINDQKLVEIPSSGELRLRSEPQMALDHEGPQSLGLTYDGCALPTITAQSPSGFFDDSAGYAIFHGLQKGDSIIVSLMVAQYLANTYTGNAHRGVRVYTPAMGPGNAVRDAKGNPTGTKAVEYHLTF